MLLTYPKVSVVISTYDRPEMLVRAVKSVMAQTFTDYEVIVVDDGSGTAKEALKDVSKEMQSLTVAELPENSGYQCVPKNIGINVARGSYVAYLDDDNEWDPEHLALLVAEAERWPRNDFVYSRWRYAGDGPFTGNESPFTQVSLAAIVGLKQSPMVNFVDSSSLLHGRAAFLALLGNHVWNPEIRRYGDWEMICRALEAGASGRGIDAVTFTYWWHGENLQLTRKPSEIDGVPMPMVDNTWKGEKSYV